MVIYPPFIALLRDRLNAERGSPGQAIRFISPWAVIVRISLYRRPKLAPLLAVLRSMPAGRTYDFRDFPLTAQRSRFPMAAYEPRNTHIWIAGLKVADIIADLESLFPDSWSLPLEYKQALAKLFRICNFRKCCQHLHEVFVNGAFCIRRVNSQWGISLIFALALTTETKTVPRSPNPTGMNLFAYEPRPHLQPSCAKSTQTPERHGPNFAQIPVRRQNSLTIPVLSAWQERYL